MIVEKVLNNNVVVSIDPTTRKEIILMGSGIAFNKKPGQLIDTKKVEKTFKKEIMESGCIGSISELYDSKTPYLPKGTFAQAWSVAEIFRVIFR